jgi:hypothetical protein
MPSWESQGVLARSTLPLEGRVETVYMLGSLTIGDFSRVTFLSVKTLRHYHQAASSNRQKSIRSPAIADTRAPRSRSLR